MLTGQADEESILRTVGVVHQFISKPSNPETLREIIDRACALQDLMENEQLQSVVSGIGQLPSLPSVYAKLQEKMKDPECSLGDVAAHHRTGPGHEHQSVTIGQFVFFLGSLKTSTVRHGR